MTHQEREILELVRRRYPEAHDRAAREALARELKVDLDQLYNLWSKASGLESPT